MGRATEKGLVACGGTCGAGDLWLGMESRDDGIATTTFYGLTKARISWYPCLAVQHFDTTKMGFRLQSSIDKHTRDTDEISRAITWLTVSDTQVASNLHMIRVVGAIDADDTLSDAQSHKTSDHQPGMLCPLPVLKRAHKYLDCDPASKRILPPSRSPWSLRDGSGCTSSSRELAAAKDSSQSTG